MTRTMKDSGIKWIGFIPKHWPVSKFKYSSIMYTGNSIKDSEKDEYSSLEMARPYISTKNIDLSNNTINYESGIYIKVCNKTFKIAPANSTLMCIEGGSAGKKKAFLAQSVCFVNKLCCFIANNNYNSKYIYYFLTSPNYEDEFISNIEGLIGGVSINKLKTISILCPSLPEQQAIADYLDDKCAQIDNITATINEQIEVLKQYKKSIITEAVTKGLDPNSPMKDSGVEWIGQIPEKWSISKMYLIADYKKGPFGSAITKNMFIDPTEEKAYKVYEQKNAIKKSADIGYYYISEEKFLSLKEFSIKPKDIIVSCDGTIGECFLLPEKCEEGIINQALMRIRLSKNIVSQYFLYLFSNSLDYLSEKYSNGSAIKNIPPFIILKKAKIPFPPLPEQQAIADYLDDKCAQIDAVIADKQAQLETLAAYKKSLIYEYVTGKKSVPGFEEA